MDSAQHAPADAPAAGAQPGASRGGPSRRSVLGAMALTGAVAGTLGATGCSRREDPKPHPDVALLTGVIAGEERLVALYEAARRAHADLAPRLDPALAHHREHLATLRRHYRQGSRPSPSAGRRPAAPPVPKVPDDRGEAVAALRAAERAAAAARVAEAGKVGPGLAQLLASIGACEAGHDTALAGAA